MRIALFACLMVLQQLNLTTASANERERALAAHLSAQLEQGRAISLAAEGIEFLGLYNPATTSKQVGNLIMLHDAGAHPDWPGVIAHLRHGLNHHGWNTLSIQLPLLPLLPLDARLQDYSQVMPQALTRLAAALAHLKTPSDRRVVLLGQGFGAALAVEYSKQNPHADIDGLILIGLQPVTSETSSDDQIALSKTLEAVAVPILEFHTQRDQASVRTGVQLRRGLIARKRRPSPDALAGFRLYYRQIEISGASPDYEGHADIVLKQIRGWLTTMLDIPAPN